MEHKFVAVLNKKIDTGKLMNALAHMTVGLSTLIRSEDMQVINYQDRDGGAHIASTLPYIILKAKNSNQIRLLRQKLVEQDIPFSSFNDCMTHRSWSHQVELSKQTPEQDLEYYGVCMFASKEELDLLTKKFSLY